MGWIGRTAVRGMALAIASLLCAFTAATASLIGLQLSLPPSDLAYGQPLTSVWADPFVRIVATQMALIGAAIGFVLAVWTLWNTRLLVSLPLVFLSTVLVSGVFGGMGPFSAIFALVFSLGVMMWCRRRFPQQQPARRRPS
jgi:hypothetical protein